MIAIDKECKSGVLYDIRFGEVVLVRVLVRVLEKLFKSFEYEYDKGETSCFIQQW